MLVLPYSLRGRRMCRREQGVNSGCPRGRCMVVGVSPVVIATVTSYEIVCVYVCIYIHM
jgi:hypothetical protein